jgi:hypothetical protein
VVSWIFLSFSLGHYPNLEMKNEIWKMALLIASY